MIIMNIHQIIINNKNYELTPFIDINILDIKGDNLEVHLKQLKNTLNISFMFFQNVILYYL